LIESLTHTQARMVTSVLKAARHPMIDV
jgi:hypothetical protein